MDERQALWDRVLRAQEDERGALEAMNWTNDREALEMLAVEAEAPGAGTPMRCGCCARSQPPRPARGAEGMR